MKMEEVDAESRATTVEASAVVAHSSSYSLISMHDDSLIMQKDFSITTESRLQCPVEDVDENEQDGRMPDWWVLN
jgi:hypothetical protein